MKRVVVDTNIIVSGTFWRGAPVLADMAECVADADVSLFVQEFLQANQSGYGIWDIVHKQVKRLRLKYPAV